jgi:hypothetical protein
MITLYHGLARSHTEINRQTGNGAIPHHFKRCSIHVSIYLGQSNSHIRDVNDIGTSMAQYQARGGEQSSNFLQLSDGAFAVQPYR